MLLPLAHLRGEGCEERGAGSHRDAARSPGGRWTRRLLDPALTARPSTEIFPPHRSLTARTSSSFSLTSWGPRSPISLASWSPHPSISLTSQCPYSSVPLTSWCPDATTIPVARQCPPVAALTTRGLSSAGGLLEGERGTLSSFSLQQNMSLRIFNLTDRLWRPPLSPVPALLGAVGPIVAL